MWMAILSRYMPMKGTRKMRFKMEINLVPRGNIIFIIIIILS